MHGGEVFRECKTGNVMIILIYYGDISDIIERKDTKFSVVMDLQKF